MRGRASLYGIAAAAVVGLAVTFAMPWVPGGTSRFVAGYDAAAIVLLAVEWYVMSADATVTRRTAAREDPGRRLVSAAVLISVAAGLVASITILAQGQPGERGPAYAAYALATGAVALGWLMIHTIFTLRYAHLYYRDANRDKKADRGLDFPGSEPPSDFDFAYFSFVIGMTFQVSDVQITSPRIRRVALWHALVSFAYNVLILAMSVNVAADLIKGS